jgi:hypothetical protein
VRHMTPVLRMPTVVLLISVSEEDRIIGLKEIHKGESKSNGTFRKKHIFLNIQ